MGSRSDLFSRAAARRPRGAGNGSPARGEKLTAGVPLAKLIPRQLVHAPEIVMLGQSRSLAAEKFRRLKTVLANAAEGSAQVIVVTSTGPAEGKSMTALNLALAFAAEPRGQVLLIDADLRQPRLGDWLSPPPQLGLSELLQGKTEAEHTILALKGSGLRILPAGQRPKDPVVLLSSEAARTALTELRQRFDRIIIDTPPVIPFTDADAIGRFGDGVLMVVRAGQTRRSLFMQAVSSITSTRILGVVFNDVTHNLADRGSYHYYDKSYYDYYEKGRRR